MGYLAFIGLFKGLSYCVIFGLTLITNGYVYTIQKNNSNNAPVEIDISKTSLFGLPVQRIPFVAFLSYIIIGYFILYYLDIKPDILRIILKYNILTISFSTILYILYEKLLGKMLYKLNRSIYNWRCK
jgi:uncharacterized membrane protein